MRSGASMSLPGVLEPPQRHGRFLVDGGIVSPLPRTRACATPGIQWVIGSNVAGQESILANEVRPPHLVETMGRMLSIDGAVAVEQPDRAPRRAHPARGACCQQLRLLDPDPLFAEGDARRA